MRLPLLLLLAACAADADGDGWPAQEDCDDSDPLVHPHAKERCDGVDEDCDGQVDEEAVDAPRWFADLDGDGWGLGSDALASCEPVAGYASDAGDCDDAAADVYPGALEICGDEIDQDCDGEAPPCQLQGQGNLRRLSRAFMVGTGPGAWTGESVAPAGDVDGDGLDDFLVGARSAQTARGQTGEAYLLTGDPAGVVALSGATARLQGEEEGDYLGFSVAGVGDLDGDGYADLAVGAWHQGADDRGAAYVIHGPVSGRVSLGQRGVKLSGVAAEDYAGFSVDGAGDMDGDGYPELVVGAHHVDTAGEDAGAVYLIRGPILQDLELSEADAILLGEEATDRAGRGVRGGGDADGDGLTDLLVGAHGQDAGAEDAGATYVVLGPVEGTLSLADADARILGRSPFDESGRSLAWAGDCDGDGHDDVLVGAWGESSVERFAGAAYLLRGPFEGDISVQEASLKVFGESAGDRAAISVGEAGDLDGNGRSDLLVGAWTVDGPGGQDQGAVYVLLCPVEGTFNLGAADARLLGGSPGERAGLSVRTAGDVDADGYDDLLVGANRESTGGVDAGAAYLLLGGP